MSAFVNFTKILTVCYINFYLQYCRKTHALSRFRKKSYTCRKRGHSSCKYICVSCSYQSCTYTKAGVSHCLCQMVWKIHHSESHISEIIHGSRSLSTHCQCCSTVEQIQELIFKMNRCRSEENLPPVVPPFSHSDINLLLWDPFQNWSICTFYWQVVITDL